MSDQKDEGAAKALGPVALVGQLGIVAAGPIVLAVLAGSWLDVSPALFIVLILVGIAAGIAGAYRIVLPFLK